MPLFAEIIENEFRFYHFGTSVQRKRERKRIQMEFYYAITMYPVHDANPSSAFCAYNEESSTIFALLCLLAWDSPDSTRNTMCTWYLHIKRCHLILMQSKTAWVPCDDDANVWNRQDNVQLIEINSIQLWTNRMYSSRYTVNGFCHSRTESYCVYRLQYALRRWCVENRKQFVNCICSHSPPDSDRVVCWLLKLHHRRRLCLW